MWNLIQVHVKFCLSIHKGSVVVFQNLICACNFNCLHGNNGIVRVVEYLYIYPRYSGLTKCKQLWDHPSFLGFMWKLCQAWKKCLFPYKQVRISLQFHQISLQNGIILLCISFIFSVKIPKFPCKELPDLPIFSRPAHGVKWKT